MSSMRKAIHVIREDYHKFEVDPATQLRYHRRMTIFWICNIPFITLLVILNIYVIVTGKATSVAILLDAIMFAINTYYSLYALICTEAGDAHGAYASMKAEQIETQRQNSIVPPADF